MTTPAHLERALAFARANRVRTERGLVELLSIPSVSTYTENKPDMERAADWIVSRLAALGCEARRIPSGGPDAVFAERRSGAVGAKTLLIYGHYDVQPAEPLEEWNSPPFAPAIRGDNLFGRGSSDMKGPLTATIAAVEAALAAGDLPIHIKFFLEGEEEIGSPHMEAFLRENRNLLSCDAVLNPDTMLISPDLPALVYGLRGLAYFELRVETAGHDLHSGVFGGAVPNAGQALCELIAGMHDDRGRVTLPGFYDDVLELDPEERAELARIPYSDSEFLSQASAHGVNGEEGYTVTERLGARPTLEVNGLLCGFTGEGSKTVLPARAMAKISMRLVPNQTDGNVQSQLEEYLRLRAPAWLKWEVLEMAGGPAALVRRDTPGMQAAIRALEAAFGARPVFIREGGSVPVVSLMQEILGRESILMGVSLPDDNLHAPNEKLHLPTFHKGVEAYIRLLYEITD
jgi:acetylornithine deacetylase/succinyl-diaminopimelate desuccinylase-like protein